jgi:hypothetical protein
MSRSTKKSRSITGETMGVRKNSETSWQYSDEGHNPSPKENL